MSQKPSAFRQFFDHEITFTSSYQDLFEDFLDLQYLTLLYASEAVFYREECAELSPPIELGHETSFPSLGLSFTQSQLEKVVLCPAGNKGRTLGFVQFYFTQDAGAVTLFIADSPNNLSLLSVFLAKHHSRAVTSLPDRSPPPPKRPLCPSCAKSAQRWRDHPEEHPLTALLREWSESQTPLHLIIPGTFVHLSRHVQIDHLQPGARLTLLGQSTGEVLLSLDLGYVHCLALDQASVDGIRHDVLKCYDSYGEVCLSLSHPHSTVPNHLTAFFRSHSPLSPPCQEDSPEE